MYVRFSLVILLIRYMKIKYWMNLSTSFLHTRIALSHNWWSPPKKGCLSCQLRIGDWLCVKHLYPYHTTGYLSCNLQLHCRRKIVDWIPVRPLFLFKSNVKKPFKFVKVLRPLTQFFHIKLSYQNVKKSEYCKKKVPVIQRHVRLHTFIRHHCNQYVVICFYYLSFTNDIYYCKITEMQHNASVVCQFQGISPPWTLPFNMAVCQRPPGEMGGI